MIHQDPSKLFRDIRPVGAATIWDPSLRNSIGSEKPRFSDERQYMDPWAARFHQPKWCFADRVTIRQRTAMVTRQVIFSPSDRITFPKDHGKANLVKGSPKGFIGRDAARRIRNIITDWTQAVNCGSSWAKQAGADHGIYFSFCTLTLPVKQFHGDKVLKQDLLNPFIKALIRDHGVVNYLWRAEPQRTGNLHFHLFLDRFIAYDLIRSYWDYHLEFLGYITAYAEQSGSLFPPATQIVTVPKDGQLRDYIAKYLSKAQARRRSILPEDPMDLEKPKHERGPKKTRISYWAEGVEKNGTKYEYEVRPIEGRVWGCSDRLRSIRPFSVLVSEVTGKWIQWLEKVKQAHTVLKKFGTLILTSITAYLKEWDQWTWRAFYWFHVEQFRYLYCGLADPPPRNFETVREVLLYCCAEIRSTPALTPTAPTPAQLTNTTPAPTFNPRSLDPIITIPF